MEFVGRQSELAHLEEEYKNEGSSFVVIYGRRRVGKTTLIKEFIKGKKAFYYLASKEIETLCLKRFSRVISRVMGNSQISNVTYHDWETLFELIVNFHPEKKKIIIIDEFPYLVKTNLAFPSILQYIWDEILKDQNIMLILCGSLVSMMKKYTMSIDSPLYGRRTSQIRLLPLNFMEVYEGEDHKDFCRAVEQYSVIGGVPKYLELFSRSKSLQDNIEKNIFSQQGFLYEEVHFLFSEEITAPAMYYSVLRAIADGNHKLDRIGSVLEMDSASIIPYITTLIELGFVYKDTPITEKNPERSRKGMYFISDPFLRFWFYYVNPFQSELELGNHQIIIDEMKKDFEEKFVAFAYENICKTIFFTLCQKGEIAFTPSRIGSFWQNDSKNDTEIDIVSVDMQHKIVFFGECKYHKNPVDAEVYFTLVEKVKNNSLLQSTYQNFKKIYGIFSKSGFQSRLCEIANENENLYLIDQNHLI